MLYLFLKLILYFSFMILNDLKAKVDGRFSKEIVVEDDGEDLVYVFPDTTEFISILRRKMHKEVIPK